METYREKLLKDPEYAIEDIKGDLIMDVTEAFCEILETEGLTRQNLAEKMGRTRGFISQVLNGDRNMTLGTLAEMAYRLGYCPEFKLEKATEKSTLTGRFTVDIEEEEEDAWAGFADVAKEKPRKVAVNG